MTQLTKNSLKLNILNYSGDGDLYHEINDFLFQIEPTRTTSIRKKDHLTIVLVKKVVDQHWDRLTKREAVPLEERSGEVLEQAQREKSQSDREERVRRIRRNPKESSPSPENEARRSRAGRGCSESPKTASDKSRGSMDRRPGHSVGRQPHRAADPFFEEISKDFKDLHKSKDKNNFLSSCSPKKPVATMKATQSASDSELMDEMRTRR